MRDTVRDSNFVEGKSPESLGEGKIEKLKSP